MVVLKMYVLGRMSASEGILKRVEKELRRNCSEGYSLEIIDLLEHPHLAEEARIIATPTLVRKVPEPVKKVVGDLNDIKKVLFDLDLLST